MADEPEQPLEWPAAAGSAELQIRVRAPRQHSTLFPEWPLLSAWSVHCKRSSVCCSEVCHITCQAVVSDLIVQHARPDQVCKHAESKGSRLTATLAPGDQAW